MGGRVAAIVHALWDFAIVALGDPPDPIGRVAGHHRDLTSSAALAEQPQDLPPGAFVGLFRRAIALLELSAVQKRFKGDVGWRSLSYNHLSKVGMNYYLPPLRLL